MQQLFPIWWLNNQFSVFLFSLHYLMSVFNFILMLNSTEVNSRWHWFLKLCNIKNSVELYWMKSFYFHLTNGIPFLIILFFICKLKLDFFFAFLFIVSCLQRFSTSNTKKIYTDGKENCNTLNVFQFNHD